MERGNGNSVALFKPSLMKKIFLLASILAFSFASAQQNEFFNIEKYMQKKQIELKKSQIKIPRFPEKATITYFEPSSQPQLIAELPNGNKVYALPQDHMPCIKPDMNQFNMPNVYVANKPYSSLFKKEAGKIPNPTIPFLELTTPQ